MDTYFGRHTIKIDIDDDTRNKIWERRFLAIHYPDDKNGKFPEEEGNLWGGRDNVSLDPADYSAKAGGVVKRLNTLAKEGGYVCAHYHGQAECLVGYIEPDTPVEFVEGRRGHAKGQFGVVTYLKAIQIQKVQRLPVQKYPIIFVGKPQQGTLCRWANAGTLIEDLVEGRPIQPSLSSLSPAQLETLCAEYLRTDEAEALGLPRLRHLLLPVGRTMKDIDIFGISTGGCKIFGQVTKLTLKGAQRKLKILKEYRKFENCERVLFCSHREPLCDDAIQIFPIEAVYSFFEATCTGRQWLEASIEAEAVPRRG